MTQEVVCTLPVLPRNVVALFLIVIQTVILGVSDVDGKELWFGFSILLRSMIWLAVNQGRQLANNNCESTILLLIICLVWLLPIRWMNDDLPTVLRGYLIFSFIDTVLFYGLVFTIHKGPIHFYRTVNETNEGGGNPLSGLADGNRENNANNHVVQIGETQNE